MFEFLNAHSEEDAINLLKKDHEKVKELFEQFANAETLREKRKIAAETILELKLHAAVEEEIFYPAVRLEIEKKIMNEADEEHHVAKLLVAELEVMDGTESHYDAKYKVLSENIRHHIKEEESDMLPKARALSIDFDVLGAKILARKAELKKTGIPTFGEETMVARSRGQGDSPAKAAETIKSPGAIKPARKPVKAAKVVKFPKRASAAAKKAKKPMATKAARVSKAKKPVVKSKAHAMSHKRRAGRK